MKVSYLSVLLSIIFCSFASQEDVITVGDFDYRGGSNPHGTELGYWIGDAARGDDLAKQILAEYGEMLAWVNSLSDEHFSILIQGNGYLERTLTNPDYRHQVGYLKPLLARKLAERESLRVAESFRFDWPDKREALGRLELPAVTAPWFRVPEAAKSWEPGDLGRESVHGRWLRASQITDDSSSVGNSPTVPYTRAAVQGLVDEIAGLPLRRYNARLRRDAQPGDNPRDVYVSPVREFETHNGRPCYLDETPQTHDVNEFLEEFTFMGRKITKASGNVWWVEGTGPFRWAVEKVTTHPAVEWIVHGKAIVYHGNEERRGNHGLVTGDYGKHWFSAPPEGWDGEPVMYAYYDHPDGGVHLLHGLPPSISSRHIFGHINSVALKKVGIVDILTVVVRHAQRMEYVFGVGDKPAWMDGWEYTRAEPPTQNPASVAQQPEPPTQNPASVAQQPEPPTQNLASVAQQAEPPTQNPASVAQQSEPPTPVQAPSAGVDVRNIYRASLPLLREIRSLLRAEGVFDPRAYRRLRNALRDGDYGSASPLLEEAEDAGGVGVDDAVERLRAVLGRGGAAPFRGSQADGGSPLSREDSVAQQPDPPTPVQAPSAGVDVRDIYRASLPLLREIRSLLRAEGVFDPRAYRRLRNALRDGDYGSASPLLEEAEDAGGVGVDDAVGRLRAVLGQGGAAGFRP